MLHCIKVLFQLTISTTVQAEIRQKIRTSFLSHGLRILVPYTTAIIT